MRPVGIVVNPVSGKDVRRLLTNAGTSTLGDKVGVVRRLLVGASEAGARRFLVLPEPHGIVRRALATLPFASELEVADAVTARHHDERDTIAAARALRAAGCAAVAVLGGDGTNRAVALDGPAQVRRRATDSMRRTRSGWSRRSAMAGMASVGPVQRQSSTSPTSQSVLRVASVRNR